MKQAEKTGQTVAKILDAAMREFGERGYSGGTVNNICKSGINKGLIYHNFKDKNEIYLICLEKSCHKLISLIEDSGCTSDLLQYMKVRMSFLDEYPNEAHILFEALLHPHEQLRERIEEILRPFDELNERIYRSVLSQLNLREGITEEDAIGYFRQMQRMFNGYFSGYGQLSPELDKQIREHEMKLPKLLDFMLYGIAK